MRLRMFFHYVVLQGQLSWIRMDEWDYTEYHHNDLNAMLSGILCLTVSSNGNDGKPASYKNI